MSCDTMEEILHQLRLVVSCSSLFLDTWSLKHPGQNMPKNLNHHPFSMDDWFLQNLGLSRRKRRRLKAETHRFTGGKIVLRKFRNLH